MIERLAAMLVGAILLCLVGYHHGVSTVRAQWEAERQRTTLAVASRQVEQAAVTERVVTKYVDRIQTVRERGKTIVEKVPFYVPSPSPSAPEGPPGCDGVLPGGFRVLHDAAATGAELPDPAAAADAPAVSAQDAAATVADNYGTCHEVSEQLTALQQWVRDQQAVSAKQQEMD